MDNDNKNNNFPNNTENYAYGQSDNQQNSEGVKEEQNASWSSSSTENTQVNQDQTLQNNQGNVNSQGNLGDQGNMNNQGNSGDQGNIYNQENIANQGNIYQPENLNNLGDNMNNQGNVYNQNTANYQNQGYAQNGQYSNSQQTSSAPGGMGNSYGPDFSYMNQKPSTSGNKKLGWILGGVAAVVVILGITGFALRDNIMKTVSPNSYYAKKIEKSLKVSEKSNKKYNYYKGDIKIEKVNIPNDDIGTNMVLGILNNISTNFEYQLDEKNKKMLTTVGMNIGGSKDLNMELYFDEENAVLALPDLVSSKFGLDGDEIDTKELFKEKSGVKEYTSVKEVLTESKKAVRASKYKKVGEESLTYTPDKKVEVVEMVIPAKKVDAFLKSLPDILKKDELLMDVFDQFGKQSNMTGKELMEDLKDTLEDRESDEDLVLQIGFLKNGQVASLKYEEKDNLFLVESYMEKGNFSLGFNLKDDETGMEFVMSGTAKEEKGVMKLTYDTLNFNFESYGDTVGIELSGNISGEYKKDLTLDYDLSKVINMDEVTDSKSSELFEELGKNVLDSDILPPSIKSLLDGNLLGGNDFDFDNDDGDDEIGTLPPSKGAGTMEVTKNPTQPSNISEEVAVDDAISYQTVTLEDNLLMYISNKGEEEFCITGKVIYYDNSDQVIGDGSIYIPYLAPGNQRVCEVSGPVDSNYDPLTYSRADITLSKEDTEYTFVGSDVKDNIEVTGNISGDKIYVQYTNPLEENLYQTELGFLFFDKDNKLIAYDTELGFDTEVGEKVTEYTYLPVDKNYDNLPFEKCQIFVNYAYTEKED